MAFQTLLISSASYLCLKNSNLHIRTAEKNTSLCLDNISSIIVESLKSTLTSSLLSYLCSKNINLIICDSSHMPNGLMSSFAHHSRHVKIAMLQVNIKKTLKNRLWQKIIIQKLKNQASFLEKIGKKEHNRLKLLSKGVLSADKSGLEAIAALIYFKSLKINRKSLYAKNLALNYGYSIIRASIANALVGYGLLPSFGIFHKSELNAFNLADDFIEPYRQFVDDAVWHMGIDDIKCDSIKKEYRVKLCDLLNKNITLTNQANKDSILYSVKKVAYSFIDAILQNDSSKIILPEFKCA